MPHFNIYDLVKWLHLAAFSIGGGAAVVALLLSGFEEGREDLRGLAATVWAKVVTWSFRIALVLGLVLLVMQMRFQMRPFDNVYLHFKLLTAFALVACSEMSPKALARAKRGAPMLALVLFLLTSFLAVNKTAFGQTAAARRNAATVPSLEPGK